MSELSLTEERVARLAGEGRSAADIAAVLELDERVVQWHLEQAMRKLEEAAALHRRLEALRRPR